MFWWQYFKTPFTPAECAEIRALAGTLPVQTGAVNHGGDKAIHHPELRRSNIRWLPRTDPGLRWLYDRIAYMALQANANGFNLDICALDGGFKDVQFTEYNAANSGHYGWHEDNDWRGNTPWDRKMSMVIQLSNPAEYEGGRLEFARDPLPDGTFVAQGDTLFFPAFLRHRVTPVTKGCRLSLVTWFVGPRLR